jgi:hypothetical protein
MPEIDLMRSHPTSVSSPGQPASGRIVQQTPTVYNRRHQNAGWLNPVYQTIAVDKAFAYIGLIQFGDDATRLRLDQPFTQTLFSLRLSCGSLGFRTLQPAPDFLDDIEVVLHVFQRTAFRQPIK